MNELHEFYYLAGKHPIDYDQKIALNIIQKFQNEIQKLEKEDEKKPEVKKNLLFLLEKCYDILSKSNNTINTLGQYDIKEVALEERL